MASDDAKLVKEGFLVNQQWLTSSFGSGPNNSLGYTACGSAILTPMNALGFISIALTSSLLTALFSQLFTWWREHRAASAKKAAIASYLSLRLAILLEAYASECASFIGENYNAETPHGEQYPAYKVKLPELPPYPDDPEGWQALDLKLASRALSLRNCIAGSQGMIRSTWEHAEDELGEELDEQAGGRGLEAWKIAVDLREKYKLEPVELIWDFRDMMQGALEGAKRIKKKNREWSDELIEATTACVEKQE